MPHAALARVGFVRSSAIITSGAMAAAIRMASPAIRSRSSAQIVRVVDIFDALTTNRPYRRAMSQREGASRFSGKRHRLEDVRRALLTASSSCTTAVAS